MKVTVVVENKQGQVLGQSVTTKERITIGRDAICTISLSDEKIAPLENEIYLLNDECWLQVSKDGASVTLKGKQYRTIKIEEGSTLFFRNYTLKVLLQASQEINNEATRVVDPIDLKTRVVSTDDAMTRVVQIEESTRIVERTEEYIGNLPTGDEKTRVLAVADEKTRVIDNIDFKPKAVVSNKKISSYEKKEEAMSFGFEEESDANDFQNSERFDQWSRSLSQFNMKDIGLTALAIFVCLFVGKWLFFSGGSQDLRLDKVASEQEHKLNQMGSKNSDVSQTSPRQDPVDIPIHSVTREEYMRSLSSFFDKH